MHTVFVSLTCKWYTYTYAFAENFAHAWSTFKSEACARDRILQIWMALQWILKRYVIYNNNNNKNEVSSMRRCLCHIYWWLIVVYIWSHAYDAAGQLPAIAYIYMHKSDLESLCLQPWQPRLARAPCLGACHQARALFRQARAWWSQHYSGNPRLLVRKKLSGLTLWKIAMPSRNSWRNRSLKFLGDASTHKVHKWHMVQ